MLCYRLGRGKGGVAVGWGANLFSASCIPDDAPSALPHTNFVLFNVTVSENVAVAFLADVLGCTLTVMETKLRPRCHLRSNLRAWEGWVGNNMRVGYVDQRPFKFIYRNIEAAKVQSLIAVP